MATPYTLTATTEETFNKGETIQVLIGSSVNIECELDDMGADVKATIAWQLKKLYLSIA